MWTLSLVNVPFSPLRYKIFEVPDGKFGVKNESNFWNGMIGVVHRQVGLPD